MATRDRLKRADAARKAARKYADFHWQCASWGLEKVYQTSEQAKGLECVLEAAYNAGIAYAERRAKREQEKGGKR